MKIQQYTPEVPNNAQIEGLRATRVVTPRGEGLDILGRGISALQNPIQTAEENDDISNGGAKVAAVIAATSQKLSDATKDPAAVNDPNFHQKIMDYYDQQVDGISDQLNTPRGQVHVSELIKNARDEFSNTAIHYQSQLKGVQAVQNATNSFQSLQSATQTIPSSHDANLQHAKDMINAMPGLDAIHKEELTNKATQGMRESQIMGMADHDPTGTKSSLLEGKFDSLLTGEQKDRLLNYAHSKESQQKSDLEYARNQKEWAQKDLTEKISMNLANKLQSGQQITHDDYNGLDLQHLTEFKAYVAKEAGQVGRAGNNAAEIEMKRRLENLPDGDPDKFTSQDQILQFVKDHNMSANQLQKGFNIFNQNGTPEGRLLNSTRGAAMKQAQVDIGTSPLLGGKPDSVGTERMNQYHDYLIAQEAQARAQGKSPLSVYAPDNAATLKQQRMLLRPTDEERMKALTGQMSNPLTPSPNVPQTNQAPTPPTKTNPIVLPKMNPGEDEMEYLKRIGAPGIGK